MNLLIVNDEQLTAETMKKDMDWVSYGISKIYTAYDTEAARACIAEHLVDILLCDIEMPGENGLELFCWVRETEKKRSNAFFLPAMQNLPTLRRPSVWAARIIS